MTGVGALTLLAAVTKSVWAVFATESAMCWAPDIVTVVLPVKEEPGKSPTFPPAVPVMTVGPVFVIVVPPRTAKVDVLPGVTVGPAADTEAGRRKIAISGRATNVENIPTLLTVFILVRFYEMDWFDIEARYLSGISALLWKCARSP